MNTSEETLALLKLSGKAFSPTSGFDGEHLDSLGGKLAYIMERRDTGLAVVTGAGNIYRGREDLDLSKDDGDFVGMTGTITNGRMLAGKLASIGVDHEMISAFDPLTCDPLDVDYDMARKLIDDGKVVIFVGGTGKPGVTTDSGAALHAAGCGIKTIWMAKDRAHGVYDGDPNKDSNAVHLPHLTVAEVRERAPGVMDRKALDIAEANDITHVVFSGDPSNRWHAFVTGNEHVDHSIIVPS